MHQHHHQKRSNKKKIILAALVVVFALAVFIYFNKATEPIVNNPNVVSTTATPVVNKPKPITGPHISVVPSTVSQGEPVILTVRGIATSTVKSFTFHNRPLITFLYNKEVTAFLGVDLYYAPGEYELVATLDDGREIRGKLVIKERPPLTKPFDIPEKLGGNSAQSIKNLISTLSAEGKIINAIPTAMEVLWTEKFGAPLKNGMVVDDPYGYTRVINNFTMPHKGVDLEAEMGTPVYSMNKGVVRLTSSLRNYGNTIIVDHGYGLQTVYMHLSEIKVTNGQTVEKGDLLGLSGDTGYVLHPHLHLTVRIWDVSIDPLKFLEILGEGSQY